MEGGAGSSAAMNGGWPQLLPEIRCAEHVTKSGVVGEVPVDGQPGDPGAVRDGGDGGRGRPDAAVHLHGGFHEALARLVHLLGPAAHPVRRPGPWP